MFTILQTGLIVSGGSIVVAIILVTWWKYCDNRKCNRRPGLEEKIPIASGTTANTTGYQITQTTDTGIPVSQTDSFIQYEDVNEGAQNAAVSGKEQPQVEQADYSDTEARDTVDEEIGVRRLERCCSTDSISSTTSDSSIGDNFFNTMGQIEIVLDYDGDNSTLTLTLVQAKELRPLDDCIGPMDTYVKLIVLPDCDARAQSKVFRKSFNPIYNERFVFTLHRDDLEQRSLQLCVYHYDKYSHHEAIGETEMRLGDVDLIPGAFSTWLNLVDVNDKPQDLGDIMFSLSYLPTAERLTVVIVKARNLKWNEAKDSADPFVKVYLLQNGKKISKKKTVVKKDERCPIYNEAMIFSVPSSVLQSVTLRVTVAENSVSGKNHSVGHVLVGPNATGSSLTHWNQMMTSLRKPAAMWHSLRKY
ncbi:synaptotagmin B-like protein [Saccoglossus kowalevskii]|uniref:Synaptotagmin B-like protein n=1 Tax=Saccoglossus kowalevskii TaxID=10224 RepID=D1LXF5_SACKO|nr:synaptotagmin B-like protein [Saccoglossus kowalevskii]ACY92661.1 synaptotagmin B-like protein [Saccoglossus kowalevskii]